MIDSSTTIKIATLNCRSLVKQNQPHIIPPFTRYLRQTGNDIFVFQETNTTTTEQTKYLELLFQSTSGIWTPKIAILSLNPNFIINTSPEIIDSTDGRYILTSISQPNNNTPIAYILAIYAPAHRAPRRIFFEALAKHTLLNNIITSSTAPVFALGDFNYDITDDTIQRLYPTWLPFIRSSFIDCFKDAKLPTFSTKRGSHTFLDYIYCSAADYYFVRSIHQEYLTFAWTDHELLSINYCYNTSTSRGRGAWKANPFLGNLPPYRAGLASHIQHAFDDRQHLDLLDIHTATRVWDELKTEVKEFTKSFQLDRNSWRLKTIKKLQSKRNRILREYKNTSILSLLLPSVEATLGKLQEEQVEIEALKAGKFWRENNENSPGVFKRLAASRGLQREIPPLMNDGTGQLTTTHDEQVEVVHRFYSQLYSPEPTDQLALNTLLASDSSRDDHRKVTSDQQEDLLAPIVLEEILALSGRASRTSSPGVDGLPYGILRLFLSHPVVGPLAVTVYNAALNDSIFPNSWSHSLMTLIPKKGDPSQLTNLRPIQLVCTDSKIFTRILNQRLLEVAPQIVNPHQLGFMPGKYIAQNGLMTQMILENAAAYYTSSQHHHLGVLLDQQKAYDRVNLEYLEHVLLHYGFPVSLVRSLYSLFKHNQIQINVNGTLSTQTVSKLRGLKQGDPISCILYNFSLEPLLRCILDDPTFSGYQFHEKHPQNNLALPPIKLLCYADDTLLFLKDSNDLARMTEHLTMYSAASNARINYHKVQAVSLSGINQDAYWLPLLRVHNIQKVWCSTDPEPVIYLGYPLLQSSLQRKIFFDGFLQKIRVTAQLHTSRNVSLPGRATIANTLILSKCWYLFAVLPLPMTLIGSIQQIVSSFVNTNFSPRLSWSTITSTKKQGGLGVLNPTIQQKALYYRWLDPLLHPRPHSASVPANFLAATVRNVLDSSNLLLVLLFPESRRSLVGTSLSTASMVVRSVDCIPRDISRVKANPLDCLLLPITSTITADSVYHPGPGSRLTKAKVSDLFSYCPTGHFLLPKPPTDLGQAFKHIAVIFAKNIRRGRATFEPFFQHCLQPSAVNFFDPMDRATIQLSLNFNAFLTNLGVYSSDFEVEESKKQTKSFRQMLLRASQNVPILLASPSSAAWGRFWALSFTYVQRNVIYRLLHKKVNTRFQLHVIDPVLHPATTCLCCLHHTETINHFFFTCPSKFSFWTGLIEEFLWPGTSVTDLQTSILSLNFEKILVRPSCPHEPAIILIVAISELWKAHWRFVIDKTMFLPVNVVAATSSALQKRYAEDHLSDLH